VPVLGVAISGNYAYLANGTNGLQVVDVADPTNPQRVGGCDTSATAQAIALSDHHAYVAVGTNGLQVVDISDPAQPQPVGAYVMGGTAQAVTISGHCAYVALGTNGLEVIDVINPVQPQWAGTFSTAGVAQSVAVSGHYAYLAGVGAYVIDISDPTNPRRVGKGADMWCECVALQGNYAYLTGDGLRVFDIANPTSPRLVGNAGGFEKSWGLALAGDGVYIAGEVDGLLILDRYQPPPRLEPSVRLDAAGFHVSFQGEVGQEVRLRRSQDLETWEDWVILPGTGSLQEVVDPSALSRGSQFYRAVVP